MQLYGLKQAGENDVDKLFNTLKDAFKKVKRENEPTWYLGIEISRNRIQIKVILTQKSMKR